MKLTLQQLEAHLWGAASILRGRAAGQDYFPNGNASGRRTRHHGAERDST
jgi:hypothetical protein